MKSRVLCGFLVLLLMLSISGCTQGKVKEDTTDTAAKEQKEMVQEVKETELIEVDNPTYIAEGIRKISIMKKNEEMLHLSYDPKEYESSHEYWKISVPYGPYAIVDTEEALKLFHKLEALEFQTLAEGIDAIDTGLEGAQTSIDLGFCQTSLEERQASLKDTAYDKSTSPSYKAKADSTYTLLIGNNDGNGAYYTALATDIQQVFLMPEEDIDAVLNTDTFGLILKVSASPSIDTVKNVTIDVEGNTYEMKREKDKYYLDNEEVEEAVYHAKYTELLSVFVTGEVKEEVKGGEELLRITLKRNKEEAGDIEITYFTYDETTALVNVNGVQKLLVPKEAVEQLKNTL